MEQFQTIRGMQPDCERLEEPLPMPREGFLEAIRRSRVSARRVMPLGDASYIALVNRSSSWINETLL